MQLVDGHTHLFAAEQAASRAAIAAHDATFAEMYADPAAKMADGPALVRALDAAAIDAAVAAGFAFTEAGDLDAQNAALIEAAQQHHDRVWPLATTNLALPGWRAELERWLRVGARGIGELRPHNQGWDPLGPEAHQLCELAAAANVPLLWHVSEPVGHAYPGKRGGISPVELIALASAHRTTKHVAAHLGGGLSFYLQMPEVREAIDSIYFDTAAVSLLYDNESVARLVGIAGPDRVIFGSDFPLLSPARQLQRLRANLGADVAVAVCGGNAAFLFGNRSLR
ncbi:MAG: amidohydrolase family protein [Dehalococcoidia bacterium]